MTRFLPFAALALAAGTAQAQAPTTGEAALRAIVDAPSIATDAVTTLHAEGDRLYIGPRLVTLEDGRFRFVDERALTPAEGTEVFSLDAEGETVWVGLGRAGANNASTASGFAYSTDAESDDPTWRRVGSALDAPGDTLQQYGQFLIPAFPVTAPENAAPFGVDYHAPTGVVWSANLFAGLRSLAPREDGTYDAADWRREVLPPDFADRIDPTDEALRFDGGLGPPQPDGVNGQVNHIAYSVLAQQGGSIVSNTVWVGTQNGINWSSDQDIFVFEIRDEETDEVVETFTERAWNHRTFDGSPDGLPGNFVLAIAENDAMPSTGQTPPDVWFSTFVAESGTEERPGVVVTRDGGQTFETKLFGESVLDFAFSTDGTVYAAGGGGLFTSRDGGETWTTTSDFLAADASQPGLRPGGYLPVVRGLTGFAVAITREDGTGDETLHLGTGQGLLSSADGGATWALFRADPGFDPDAPTAGPDRPCSPCARPNPFSPRANGEVLIDFPYSSGSARALIYDVAGVLVREIDEPRPRPSSALLGTASVAWDGRDDDGVRVANGPYFFAVQADGETHTGKILVLQ